MASRSRARTQLLSLAAGVVAFAVIAWFAFQSAAPTTSGATGPANPTPAPTSAVMQSAGSESPGEDRGLRPVRALPPTAVPVVQPPTVPLPVLRSIPEPEVPGAEPWPESDVVRVRPGDDLAALASRSPEGTTFVLVEGEHRVNQVAPRNGQRFIGERGAVLDGGGAPTSAFRNFNEATDVVIADLAMTNYMPGDFLGVVHVRPPSVLSYGQPDFDQATWAAPSRWELRNLDVFDNDAIGIVASSATTITDVRVHRNGWGGIRGAFSRGVLISGSEISWNGETNLATKGLSISAAGLKFSWTRDFRIERSHIHHNYGRGVWFDISSSDVVVTQNRIDSNVSAGVSVEISYDTIIRDNLVLDNAADLDHDEPWIMSAGILVSTSENVEISRNHVQGSENGIAAIDVSGDRGTEISTIPEPLRRESLNAADLTVVANTVCDGSVLGMRANEASLAITELYRSARWDGNTYAAIEFADATHFGASFGQWQLNGHDPNGELVDQCPSWTDPR